MRSKGWTLIGATVRSAGAACPTIFRTIFRATPAWLSLISLGLVLVYGAIATAQETIQETTELEVQAGRQYLDTAPANAGSTRRDLNPVNLDDISEAIRVDRDASQPILIDMGQQNTDAHLEIRAPIDTPSSE